MPVQPMHFRTLPRLLALLLFVAVPGTAQEDPAASETDSALSYFDVVEVEVANIDVWVTDREGKAVTDLTAEDFVVRRDGRPIEISNFYAVADGRPREQPTPTVDPTDDAAASTEPDPTDPHDGRASPREAAPIDPAHRLWLIVYIDNYNLDPIQRNRVLPDLWRFLGRTLRPEDQAMLITYNRKLEVQQPFTDNVAQMQRAIEELDKESGQASLRQRFRFDTLKRIDEANGMAAALGYARQYAEEQMNGVSYTVDALRRMIDTLGGLPGRKALLHVSSGIPMAAGEEMFHVVAEKFGGSEAYAEIPRHDTSREFESVGRHANAHRVAFYTLDAGGLQAFAFGAAEYGGFVTPNIRSTLDSIVPENLQAPLRLLALETGGKAILNQNDVLTPLEAAAQDFRSFYSLGIQSVSAETGRYHSIEVELKEKQRGWQVRHRPGYRSKTMDTRVREGLQSALLYSYQSNPLEVRITPGFAERTSDGNYLLPVRIEIPLQNLVFLPRGDGKSEISLRLFYGAVGKDAGASAIDAAPLGLRIADEHVEAARREAMVHNHRLRVAAGRKKIGVAVVDLAGRITSIVTGYVQVGPDSDSDD